MKTKPQNGWLRINGKMVRIDHEEPKLPEPVQSAPPLPITLSGIGHLIAVPVRV